MSTLPDPRLNLRHKTPTRPDHARRSKTTATLLRPETPLFLAGRAVAVGLDLGWDNLPAAEALRACPAMKPQTRGTHSGPGSGALRSRPQASTLGPARAGGTRATPSAAPAAADQTQPLAYLSSLLFFCFFPIA